ncbi:hypothetical protein HR45_18675 [Shewanella mangrovi]|uniref:Phage shock protein PspC N-terminal domain-containing protein n=1 Tax=Shewanella mangrovi TaxID=1515746 RepID=A0A094JU79_9GAMM|nr:hypothetical protein [Shewanella mangrovi]KFZ36031.1 hypothetical protein HR45_18675 [Shewanella mangrovi]
MNLADRLQNPKKWLCGLSNKLATDLAWSLTGVRLTWIVLGIIQPLTTLLVYFGLSALYPKLRNR